ncbi:thymus-specific serine protease-like [Liolophura sinensis]|uniref:thymus-specific serine protease-like n=1 Tax=Liolophura sinensis TaxID=3198878 RepID=UPI0031584C3D
MPKGVNLRGSMPGARVLPPTERWVTQKVDQLTYTDKRTWQQRYFISEEHYTKGGPIFLMLGGEREANPAWLQNGQWVRQALQHKAMLIYLEHRYYGQSRPTSDISVSNLQYLTVEQALEDVANFQRYISTSLSLANDTTWIVFGGSYAGTLAAWFRLKYPDLVNAAVASSAPVFPTKDFKDYYVTAALSLLLHGGADCYNTLINATMTILNYTTTDSGREQLQYIITLCEPMTTVNKQDIANVFSTMASYVGEVVQFNNGARQFEGIKGWNYGIKEFCTDMSSDDPYAGDPIYRYSRFLSARLGNSGKTCLEHRYSRVRENLKDTDWDSDVAKGERQWLYQSCTQFGFFQTSESNNQPFGSNFPDSYFLQMCKDVFNTEDYDLDEGIYELQQKYGGYSPNISHAIFVTGQNDPWVSLGITKNLPNDVTAINIYGAAHCADMYPDYPMDTVELVQARLEIDAILAGWISRP